jgi:hypothetical protein
MEHKTHFTVEKRAKEMAYEVILFSYDFVFCESPSMRLI